MSFWLSSSKKWLRCVKWLCQLCNITGIVWSFLSDPLQGLVWSDTRFAICPSKGFQHHHSGFKMMLIHLFFVRFEGAYSKPYQSWNLFTQMTAPHKRSIWWVFYHFSDFSYSKQSSRVHTRKGMTEIGDQLIWARSSLKEILMCFHLRLFTSNLIFTALQILVIINGLKNLHLDLGPDTGFLTMSLTYL